MNPTRTKLLKAWLPSFIWLVLIAIESTDWLSSANTSRILYPILHFLTGVGREQFAIWNFYIRKTGHVVGYFVLSWVMFNSWRASLPIQSAARWSLRWARISFLLSVMVAAMDEWHQTFIASRTGTWHDLVLDSAAALTAQVLVFFWIRFRIRRQSKRLALADH